MKVDILLWLAFLGLLAAIVFLSGCMTADQKYDLQRTDALTRQDMATNAPAVIKAATSVVSCGLDPMTMTPIPGANCAGLYVQIGAGQDEVMAITKAMTPDHEVTGAEAGRDIGMAVVNGLFSPTSALLGLGMYGIKHAGEDNSARNYNSNNDLAVDSSSHSVSVDRSGNTVGISDTGNTSTVGDVSDFQNDKENYGSGNTAGGNQGVVNESPASIAPTIDFSPDDLPAVE